MLRTIYLPKNQNFKRMVGLKVHSNLKQLTNPSGHCLFAKNGMRWHGRHVHSPENVGTLTWYHALDATLPKFALFSTKFLILFTIAIDIDYKTGV